MSAPTSAGPEAAELEAPAAVDETGTGSPARAPRSGFRRALPWIIVGVAAVVIAVFVAALAQPDREPPPPLSASSTLPDGAMAVAEVLRSQGVDVVETSSLAETERASQGRNQTTVLVFDPDLVLTDEQNVRLLSVAQRLVVVEPYGGALEKLAPGVLGAGQLNGSYDADCDVVAVQKAEVVQAPASAYRLEPGEDGTACLTVAGDLSALIEVETVGTRVTVLGAGAALQNDHLELAGNAALALNLLGETDTLIWYLPSAADLYEDVDLTLDQLQAPWTLPLTVLLAAVALAAMFWRGRRFGPLVIENLPVAVRAGETMEGRARLYERGATRLHALDSLRIGTVTRLARVCGLPRTASVDEVVDAVAARTGRPRAEVADLLVDSLPDRDADLVRFSDALLGLEAEVARSVRPM